MIGEEILEILYFAIPGVLTEFYVRQFKPSKKISEQFELYILITFSVVEWVLFYFIVSILTTIYASMPSCIKEIIPQFILDYGEYVLMLGIIWGCAKVFLKWNKIRVKKLLPLDTAWDSFFLFNPHVFMEIHLINGDIIYGEYANKSYASSNGENMDIYLERIYETDQDKKLIFDAEDKPIEIRGNKGILILKDQIQYIIIFKDEGENVI